MIPFQDRYRDEFAHCFGCGRLNEAGWAIKSVWSEADPDESVSFVRPGGQFTGGWPDNLFGGVIASLLDCHSAGTASATRGRALGLPDAAPLPRCVTASLKVDFRRPTPLGVELELRARARQNEGRKVWVDARVIAAGEVCATSEALMVQVPD
jgi:acyl-coenzyme A thioesterase PaaI-like protein